MTNPLEAWKSGHGSLKSIYSKVMPFDSLHMVSYCRLIVTLCLKCTVFKISRHWSRIAEKLTTLDLMSIPLCPANPSEYPHNPYFARNWQLRSMGYIFVADSMGLSSFKFLWWAPKDVCNATERRIELRHMIGTGVYFINWLQKFGELSPPKKIGGQKHAKFRSIS